MEREVLGEPDGVALDGLVECLRRHAVETREVGIENDALAAEREDAASKWIGMGFGRGEILRAVNDGVTLAREAKPAR